METSMLSTSYRLLAAAGLLAMVSQHARAANYNFYFNNTEQGDNSTATPFLMTHGDGKVYDQNGKAVTPMSFKPEAASAPAEKPIVERKAAAVVAPLIVTPTKSTPVVVMPPGLAPITTIEDSEKLEESDDQTPPKPASSIKIPGGFTPGTFPAVEPEGKVGV